MRCLLCGNEPEGERCAIMVSPEAIGEQVIVVVICTNCIDTFEERSYLMNRRDLLSVTGAPEFKLSLS